MTVSASRTAQHVHLMRTAALAGAAFAPAADEAVPTRLSRPYATVAWVGIALVAGGALLLLV